MSFLSGFRLIAGILANAPASGTWVHLLIDFVRCPSAPRLLPFRAKESNPHVNRTCELSRDVSRDEEACAEQPKLVGTSTTNKTQLKTRASAAFSP